MIWNILLLMALIWIIVYLKNKKAILALPYLLILFITPIYNILDQKVFVKVFGCGCVPYTQTNMFNINFNANNLRFVVYIILSIALTILGIFLSKRIESKISKIIYVITIFVINILLTFKICQLCMWA